MDFLTLIWVGPLGVCFEGGRGGVVVKLPPPPSSFVEISLELR